MYQKSEKALPGPRGSPVEIPFPWLERTPRIPTNPRAIPTPHPTLSRLPDGREALKSPAGKIKISFPESCGAFASRIPADTICSPIMTQTVLGKSDCSRLARSEFWGCLAARAMPRRASVGPQPGCPASGAPAPGPPSLCRPRCGLQTFPAPAPTPTPTRSFPVGESWAQSRVSARSCPN